MVRILEHAKLSAIARGFSLLGSGGGGTTTLLELALADASAWPITLYDLADLDPALPCLGAAFVGSTMLLGERLPGEAPFAPLIHAAERWLGDRIPIVCSLEGGGLNGLTSLVFASKHRVVDADLTGRAVPDLDQMSLLVDRVPGVFATCDTGVGGVLLVQTDRPIDLERVIRSAVIQAGGAGGAVFAGFTVGDLAEHAIHGSIARALHLGTAFEAAADAPLSELAEVLGGRVLGQGRIMAIDLDANDPHVSAVLVDGEAGEIHRIITRSESLAFITDGLLQASTPTIIVVLDAISRDILQVTDLTIARNITIIGLPGPDWWSGSAERIRHVVPSAYGLAELDGGV
ncbi:DUF917 family protein [Cryobacterium sp. Y50]|uniref:S-methyl thiohydantoin desulfurase domain-containing protein n=1 Tax=Cryobacterium sp. Y50 TaxID=2048286 RepID=UPI000CE4D8E8|nr:DUF917 family protein [Cryobacterium sp. Y50]